MGRLDDIILEDPQEVREQTEGEISRERVLAAIGRKQGDLLDTLAERHGVAENTIRNWLDRFEEEPIDEAPYDEPRGGRPRNLMTINARQCSNSSESHRLNSVTSNKLGQYGCSSSMSKMSMT